MQEYLYADISSCTISSPLKIIGLSFAEHRLFYRALLQKRPIRETYLQVYIYLSSCLVISMQEFWYVYVFSCLHVCVFMSTHKYAYVCVEILNARRWRTLHDKYAGILICRRTFTVSSCLHIYVVMSTYKYEYVYVEILNAHRWHTLHDTPHCTTRCKCTVYMGWLRLVGSSKS